MPEYLAPAVYVEEVDTGSKPIEGLSTSTAGMIGVTERGPANVPVLITSTGEYARWFGERLDPGIFVNPSDANDLHCFLPHAVEGFFTNGGKRLYITRVESEGAQRANFEMHDRGQATAAMTWLLRSASELTGTAATPMPIYVLNINSAINSALTNTVTLTNGDRIRVGGGSDAEYRVVDTVTPPGTDINHVSLATPLARAHDAASMVEDYTRAVLNGPFLFAQDAAAGATTIVVTANAGDINNGELLEIGDTADASELRFVVGIPVHDAVTGTLTVHLDSPLANEHASGTQCSTMDLTIAPTATNSLDVCSAANDRVLYLTTPRTDFSDRSNYVIIDRTAAGLREARRIGCLAMLSLNGGAFEPYPAGSTLCGVTLADDGAVAAKACTTQTASGATVITLDNRVGLDVDDVIRIGVGTTAEYATIAALPSPAPGTPPAAPNAGNVILRYPLAATHPMGTVVQRQQVPVVRNDRPLTSLVHDVAELSSFMPVTDGVDNTPNPIFLADEFVRVRTADGQLYYHQLQAKAVNLDARPVSLTVPLTQPYAGGSPVAERARLLDILALDTGAWGNRLRISVSDEAPGLVARTPVIAAIAPSRIRLTSVAGIESGTILELVDAASSAMLEGPIKVNSVDRATGELNLDATAALTGGQLAALNGAPPMAYFVRSREFSLTVRLLRQPDASVPSRNQTELAREVFRNLSMDSRHSRYVQTVIGDRNGPPRLSDRRPDGESWYIRVHDVAQDLAEPQRRQTLQSVRLGPEILFDILPDSSEQPARHPMEGGNDSMATLNDEAYIGIDDVNPENRTGLFALRNIEDISIVACPGRTSVRIQNGLISHCELARYRFAVLDAHRTPRDTIADVQHQRQQFDSKYAALYHPWLLVPHPFPTSSIQVQEYSIPPSGHMLGIYARTDIERGVHKAPANEVVRGITGLQRILNKEQQDILNPYPMNINVIRDFRNNYRGIRVYGGRCITSDSDWKYVNVRRLLIFIETSIDRGLQWVVFEPNAEPLWARVRRSISNFLTLVWRNGGLEGTKPEEAFFVKCDRTTMTQTDIDSGRLICMVGVAPVKPAEFVIVRIGLWTAHAED